MSHHFWSNPSSVQIIYIVIKGGRYVKIMFECGSVSPAGQVALETYIDLETLDSIFCILETGEREEVSSRVMQSDRGYHFSISLATCPHSE